MKTEIDNKVAVAVFYAQPDKLIDALENGQFDPSWLQDAGNLVNIHGLFPIWRISQCWDAVSVVEGWKDDYQPVAADFRRRNNEIIRLFQERLDVEFTPIDYEYYRDNYYIDDLDDTPEEQLGVDSIQELLDAGVRQIDIDLYCAFAKYQPTIVKNLLERGANPAAWLPDPFPSGFQVDDNLGTECSFLGLELGSAIEQSEKHKTVHYLDCSYLLKWAAFESLYQLIENYRQYPHCQYPHDDET